MRGVLKAITPRGSTEQKGWVPVQMRNLAANRFTNDKLLLEKKRHHFLLYMLLLTCADEKLCRHFRSLSSDYCKSAFQRGVDTKRSSSWQKRPQLASPARQHCGSIRAVPGTGSLLACSETNHVPEVFPKSINLLSPPSHTSFQIHFH